MNSIEVANMIRRGKIDCNNQSSFFGILIKGLMLDLRKYITIRGKVVPHYIPNTGDETMMLEVKGHDISIEPVEVSNENYIYTQTPRCVVTPHGITLQPDQLTSPYSNGVFQIEYDEQLFSFISEFRRMPLTMSFDLTYIVDSFTDFLELTQHVVSKMAFVRNFKIVYMGQTIKCSYKISESMDGEHTIEFDESESDNRRHKLPMSIEVETNFPVYSAETVMPTDKYIKGALVGDDGKLLNGTIQLLTLYPQGGIDKNVGGEDPHDICDHTKLLKEKLNI